MPCYSSICKTVITNTWKIMTKIKNHYIGYFLEVDGPYAKKCHDFQNDLAFLPERMKTENIEKLLKDSEDKEKKCHTHKKFKTRIKSWINLQKKCIEILNIIKKLG